jgi:hypothetical protein
MFSQPHFKSLLSLYTHKIVHTNFTRTIRSSLRYSFYIFVCLSSLLSWSCTEDESSTSSMSMTTATEAGSEAENMVDVSSIDMTIVDMLPPDMGSSIDDRCPNAQAQNRLLVLYADRVDIFKRDELGFLTTYDCTFLALSEQGVTEASGLAYDESGNFYVVQAEGDAGGSIYVYSNNGEYIKKIGPDINLKEVKGIWPMVGEFVVWSARNANLYKFNPSDESVSPYNLPQQVGSRILNLTDLQYLGVDSENSEPMVLATFSDRPPQLFAFPFSPSFEADEMGPAHAITTVDTPIGIKFLISGQIEGGDDGIMRYRPVSLGRVPPTQDGVLVYATDPGYGDGKDMAIVGEILFVLDSGSQSGTPSLNSFNAEGFPQEQNPLNRPGTPLALYQVSIFQDF